MVSAEPKDSAMVGPHHRGSRGRPLLLLLILLVSLLSAARSHPSEPVVSPSEAPTELCPPSCTCTEEPKTSADTSDEEEGVENISDKSSGAPDSEGDVIRDPRLRVRCRAPEADRLQDLHLPGLLLDNTVLLDLTGSGLSLLGDQDFTGRGSPELILQKLVLRGNRISEVGERALRPLRHLEHLDLSGNRLTRLPSRLLADLPTLQRLTLSRNPLHCDCQLAPLVRAATQRRPHFKLQGACWSPPVLKDRPLSRLSVDDLACPTSSATSGDSSPAPAASVVVEVRPSTNQIVFEGDPLKLTCRVGGAGVGPAASVRILWLHQAAAGAGAQVVAPAPANGIEVIGSGSESRLHIGRLRQALHAGDWICSGIVTSPPVGGGNRSVAAAAAAPTTTTTASKSVQVTVLSLTTPACPASTTASNRGRYAWPRTVAEGRVQAPCRANPHASAWRRCSPTGVWLEPDLAACSYLSEVTKVLEQFARTNLTFSKTSALESARRLKSYLNDVAPQLHDPHDALFVTQTLHNYLDAAQRHPQLLPVIMDVVSILVKQEPALLAESRHALLALLQQAPLKSQHFEYQSSSLAVHKTALSPPSGGGAGQLETCTWKRQSTVGQQRLRLECLSSSSGQVDAAPTPDTEASVRIPLASLEASPEAVESALPAQPQTTVVLSLLASANALTAAASSAAQTPGLEMVTPVCGVASGAVSAGVNRTAPLTLTLRLVRPIRPGLRLVAARYNVYTADWSRDQCLRVALTSSSSSSSSSSSAFSNAFNASGNGSTHVTFQCCCGFGFFAAFVSRPTPTGGPAAPSAGVAAAPAEPLTLLLPAPVYVGSAVCLVCHLAAAVTYLVQGRRLRLTRPTRHALTNGWTATALLVAVFTVAVRPAWNHVHPATCQAVGLVLHYTTLSCLLWMVVAASGLYKHLTKRHPLLLLLAAAADDDDEPQDPAGVDEPAEEIGGEPVEKPALRFYLMGWGVPLIVVGIAGAIHLEQYGRTAGAAGAPPLCFLAKTPALGAVGLPAAILVLLVLTFHLLTWCYLRHRRSVALHSARHLAARRRQTSDAAAAAERRRHADKASSLASSSADAAPSLVATEMTLCVLGTGYLPLLTDSQGHAHGAATPTDPASLCQHAQDRADHPEDQHHPPAEYAERAEEEEDRLGDRGEAEGGGGGGSGNRSDLERPLLLVTSCSEDGLETQAEDTDPPANVAANADAPATVEGHSNPLMASFLLTDDADSKKSASLIGCQPPPPPPPLHRVLPSGPTSGLVPVSLAPAPADVAVSVAAAGNDAGDDDDDADRDGSDEKSATQQLRGQLTSLLLLGGAWLSAVGVVGRPLRAWLPYDELLCSLAYALCSAALGLHVLLFHLLSRRDVVLACGAAPKPYRRPRNKPPAAHTTAATTTTITPSAPAEPALQENAARDKAPDSAHPTLPALPALPAHPVHPPVVDPMVEVLDAATQLVNSFYDPRQSKTARRFFQKQKLLNQMAGHNNHHGHVYHGHHRSSSRNHHHHHHHHQHYHHHQQQQQQQHGHHRHRLAMNNAVPPSLPPSEGADALLNACSSSVKAKVSNVNIHVELGAYDWHELQASGRLSSDNAATPAQAAPKTQAKLLLPHNLQHNHLGPAGAGGGGGGAASVVSGATGGGGSLPGSTRKRRRHQHPKSARHAQQLQQQQQHREDEAMKRETSV